VTFVESVPTKELGLIVRTLSTKVTLSSKV
jgi:hypothetical protein